MPLHLPETHRLPIRRPSTTHTPGNWQAPAHTPGRTFRFSNKTIIPICPGTWMRGRTRKRRQRKQDLLFKHHHRPTQPTVLDNELRLLL